MYEFIVYFEQFLGLIGLILLLLPIRVLFLKKRFSHRAYISGIVSLTCLAVSVFALMVGQSNGEGKGLGGLVYLVPGMYLLWLAVILTEAHFIFARKDEVSSNKTLIKLNTYLPYVYPAIFLVETLIKRIIITGIF